MRRIIGVPMLTACHKGYQYRETRLLSIVDLYLGPTKVMIAT
jgi:hypothetical protein